MKKTAIIAAMLFLGAARAGAQVDSCLCIWGAAYSYAYWNPDTVMVDTCKSHMGFPPSSNKYVYSKHYVLVFQYAVIKLDSVSSDSTLTVPWTYIDTTYSQFKSICENLATMYDGLWFTKLHPSVGDSLKIGYGDFELSIGNYAQVDSIIDTLWVVPIINSFNFNRPTIAIGGVKPAPRPEPFKLIFLDDTHVLLNGITHRTNYTIVNFLGETELQSTLDPDESIDLSSLPHGFYILRLDGNQTFKIVR
jgi:hypothetical protein